MKKVLFIFFSLVMMLGFVIGCSEDSTSSNSGEQNTTPSDEELTIKVGLVVGDWAPHYEGFKKMKELVEEKSDGDIVLEGYPDGQLGGEREMLEGVQQGSLEMGLISSVVYSNFDDRASAMDIPYLVTNYEDAEKMMDGPGRYLITNILQSVSLSMMNFGKVYLENNKKFFRKAP